MERFAGTVGPGKGQGKQPHHFGQASRVSEVGILEIEAPGLQAAEQRFDLPAVGVGVDSRVLGRTRGRDNEEFAVIQAQRGQVDEASPDRATPHQSTRLAGFERA